MLVMGNRVGVSLVVVVGLLFCVGARTADASVCDVVIGQDVRSISRHFSRHAVGPSVFMNSNDPGRVVKGEKIELRTKEPCHEVLVPDEADEVPDLIVDIVSRKVVGLTFRPKIQDCEAVKSLISSIIGPAFVSKP